MVLFDVSIFVTIHIKNPFYLIKEGGDKNYKNIIQQKGDIEYV